MRQNRSMGLARPRSREIKKKKSDATFIFRQNSPSHGGATGYSIGIKFGRMVGPLYLITLANFKLGRLRTGCVALHESLLCFRFSALHRLSPLSQLGPAGPLVMVMMAMMTIKGHFRAYWRQQIFCIIVLLCNL